VAHPPQAAMAAVMDHLPQESFDFEKHHEAVSNSHFWPEGTKPAWDGDELVTLDDGRTLPRKKTICVPRGNNKVPAGPRVKLTAKLREEAERNEMLLRTAAQNGAMINLKELIDMGTDVNCRAQAAGATPLICAAIKGNIDCSRALVDAGADPELGNSQCATPISVAAKWNQINLVRFYLEECKVDPRQSDNSPAPVTPLDHAKEMQNEDMFELITKFWLLFDERDRKKLSKKEANAKKAGEAHRAAVSKEAQARREAQPPVSVS